MTNTKPTALDSLTRPTDPYEVAQALHDDLHAVLDEPAAETAISPELSAGIASYRRTWDRFDGLVCSAQCGSDPSVRQVGVFASGECQPTITDANGRRYVVRDLGSLRVE